jgi:large subunit ribosomal protein L25
MEAVELKAQYREDTGKGRVKRLRAQGLVPCVIYGKDIESKSIAVKDNELEKLINKHGENCLIKLFLGENGEEKEYLTLVRDIQRHPIKNQYTHLDFYNVSMKDKLYTTVTVHLAGEPVGVKEGGILQHGARELEIRCLPINIPEYAEVDISNLSIGDNVSVADINLGDDVEIITEEETILATIVPPAIEKEDDEEETEEFEVEEKIEQDEEE